MKLFSTQMNMDLMPLFTKANETVAEADTHAVRELCRHLSGISDIRYVEVAKRLALVSMPSGYMHVRIFADQQELTSCFSTDGEPVSPSMIATLVMIHPRFLEEEWVSTRPLFDNPHGASQIGHVSNFFRQPSAEARRIIEAFKALREEAA